MGTDSTHAERLGGDAPPGRDGGGTADAVSMAIRVRLLRVGKTQTELADESHVSPVALSRWLNGQSVWTLEALDKLAPPLGFQSGIDIATAAKEEQRIQQQIHVN